MFASVKKPGNFHRRETESEIPVDLGLFIVMEVIIWSILLIGFDSNWNKRLHVHAVPASLSSSLPGADVDGWFSSRGRGQELITAQVMLQGRPLPPPITHTHLHPSPAPPLLRTHRYRSSCHSCPECPSPVLRRDWITEAKHQQVCGERASGGTAE